jgi:hypothetical protein
MSLESLRVDWMGADRAELAAEWLDSALARNFSHYVRHSSQATELSWVGASHGGELAGVAPVVRLQKRRVTDLLRRPVRRWIGPLLGPLAKKTTLLVDTAFLAYDAESPFLTAPGVDRTAVKNAIAGFLERQRKVDSVWISEPPVECAWLAARRYLTFHTLPMVQVELEGASSYDEYVAALPKKRRRNLRHEQETFDAAGGVIEAHPGPLERDAALCRELTACLDASAAHSSFSVPYNDVLVDPHAFATQSQTALVARVAGRAVGFMSFIEDRGRLMQCHGGLDYERSHEALAYHNLIAAGIRLAVDRGLRLMSMGPLNNETKRRAGGVLRPIVSGLWNKNPVDHAVAKWLFVKNFEVYCGELGAAS